MSEKTDAIKLANKVLDEPGRDPDDDLSMLARQFLRSLEIIEAMHKQLQAVDWQGKAEEDLIQANRDEILKKHEEAVRLVRKQCEYLYTSLSQSDSPPPIVVKDLRDHAKLALDIIEALSLFHPMHGESWRGFPSA